jgi:hypothetical protein
MATTAMAVTDENEVLRQFLRIASAGFKEEDDALLAQHSMIHRKSRGVWFADDERVHAYLIRRVLAKHGFSCDVDYEYSYPSCTQYHADLVIFVTCGGQSQSIAIEMKWVTDQDEKTIRAVIDDAQKLAAEGNFHRRFLLLFPMAFWGEREARPISGEEYAARIADQQGEASARFTIGSVITENGFLTRVTHNLRPPFTNFEVPFHLDLIEIVPCPKSAP